LIFFQSFAVIACLLYCYACSSSCT